MGPKRPVLALDFDDVLFDCNSALRTFHNKRYGTKLTRHDHFSYWLGEVWKCPEEEAIRRVNEFFFSPEHTHAQPLPFAQEALRMLNETYDVTIVTSRPENVRDLTLVWLNEHFPKLYSHAYFTGEFDHSKTLRKSDVCNQIRAEYLVEDSLFHAYDVANTETKVLLLDAPWNQESIPPTIHRVHSWKVILEHLSKF